MIGVALLTTPNGHKVTMFLEEAGIDYRIVPVNISTGDQFKPEFLAVAPNNRIPAIVDYAPTEGSAPISVFESGAILHYLADKTGKFIPADIRGRTDVLQWLFWQMGGLAPMAGQNTTSNNTPLRNCLTPLIATSRKPIASTALLNKRLADRPFVAGAYSIADMASYPWIVPYERQGQNLDDFPHLKRWFHEIAARPATLRAYGKAKEVNTQPTVSEEAKKLLFGQTAAVVKQT